MKKTILLLLAFISLSFSQLVSQNTGETDPADISLSNTLSDYTPFSKAITGGWYPANTFPLLPDSTIYPAAAIIGDTIYVQKPEWTGSTTYASSNVIKYRINRYGGGSWSNAASLPAAKVGGSMTACNGKIYFIGGDNSTITGAGTNTVYEYSPATGVWTTKAPMPVTLAAHSSVCWGDSVIFVIGGPYNSSATNLNVYFYRPASNTWGTITNSLPSGQGRRTFSAGIYQNKIIIGGGYGSVWLKNVFVGTIGSNATQITWAAAPDLPITATYTGLARAGGTAVNDFFFVVAGQYSSGFRSDSTLVYQFSTNSWVSVFDNKPFNGDNIFNGVVSRIELNDTIQVYSPGIYRGATIGGTRVFDVFKFKFTPDGISVYDKQIPLKLFPNPSSGIININTGQQSFCSYDLDIVNNQGQIVYSSTITKENKQIELGDLPKGIYIIKIQNAIILKTQKLILN